MPTSTDPPRHRVATLAIVALATLTAFLSVYALWVRAQLLDGPTWADTSTRIVQDEQVRRELAASLAARLTDNRTVRDELGPLLINVPAEQVDTVRGQLRTAIEREAFRGLGTAPVARLWRASNLEAQRELVRILDGDREGVTVRGGRVTVDLRPLLRRLGRQVGLPDALVGLVPARDARLVVMRSSDLVVAQDIVRTVRDLSVVLPAVTVLLWLLALALGRGRRRVIVMQIGLGLIVAGAGVLLTRALAGDAVVFALVERPSQRGAGDQVWALGTSLLRDGGLAVLVAGVVLLGGAARVGNGRWRLNREDEAALLG